MSENLTDLPFQLQLRTFGPKKMDYWLVLETQQPADRPHEAKYCETSEDCQNNIDGFVCNTNSNECGCSVNNDCDVVRSCQKDKCAPIETIIFAVPQKKFEILKNCYDRAVAPVFKNVEKDINILDCGDPTKFEKGCEYIAKGTYSKKPGKNLYTVQFTEGDFAGDKLVFSWGGPRRQGWRFGTAWPKECVKGEGTQLLRRPSPEIREPEIVPEEITEPEIVPEVITEVVEEECCFISTGEKVCQSESIAEGSPEDCCFVSTGKLCKRTEIVAAPRRRKAVATRRREEELTAAPTRRTALKKRPAKKTAIKEVGTLENSEFFANGYYRKAEACPKTYTVVNAGEEICGKEIDPDEAGSSKLDVKKSLRGCLSDGTPYIVETKFNGHRGILEYKDGKAGIFSGKGLNYQPLPMGVSRLAANYLAGHLSNKPSVEVSDAIFDGEIFLKECIINGTRIVPEIGVQTSAIKGNHPELMDKCKFSYQVFDVIRLNGRDVSDLPLRERKELIKQIFPQSISARMSDVTEMRDETAENLFIDPVLGSRLTSIDAIYDEYCKVTNSGHEGLVIKKPEDGYTWRGRKSAYRKGWYKLKEEFDVDAAVMKACLGPWKKGTKTNQHLTRYKDLRLFVCKDEDCDNMLEVGKTASHAGGGSIKGWDGWDEVIHYPLLKMLLEGTAHPSSRTQYRKLNDIKSAIREGTLAGSTMDRNMEIMMGCDEERGCYKDQHGNVALPQCIDIPKNEFIIEVVTTEINMDRQNNPHLGGPPRVIRIRTDKNIPNDVDYLKQLYGQEVGIL